MVGHATQGYRAASIRQLCGSDLFQRNGSLHRGGLTREEIDVLVAAPDQSTWAGRRDRTLLLVAAQTGLRASELIGLRCQDVVLGTGAHVRCLGKGRKERCTPLRKDEVAALRHWLPERNGQPSDVVFPNAQGSPLSRDGLEYLLAKHLAIARSTCPSLKAKRVSPHVLRHSAAMDLLHHGVDRSVIALWLGHESMETTQIYLHANLALKEQALAKTNPLKGQPGRYRPGDKLLTFLDVFCLGVKHTNPLTAKQITPFLDSRMVATASL